MWVQAEYLPASLFSLKLSLATSSGARSLLVPTPFAIKTALVDAALRTEHESDAGALTESLVGSIVALRPCHRATVTNLFVRVLKPRREDGGGPARPSTEDATPTEGEPPTRPPRRGADRRSAETEEVSEDESGPGAGPYGKTIAYHEYVHLDGCLGIAIEVDDRELAGQISRLFTQIGYFGRRGSFFQITGAPEFVSELPAGFISVGVPQRTFAADGLIQVLDDWGAEMTFDKLNIYSPARIRLGRERVLHSTVLPYRRVSSSRSFTQYQVGS